MQMKETLRNYIIKLLQTNVSPKFLLKLKKIHYFILLRKFSCVQEPCLKVVRLLINDGDCAVDVGANIGVYTKYLSWLVGHSGLVYSIEPIPSTFEILASNIKLLKLDNVKQINCAISESDITQTMEIPLDERGFENHYLARIVKAGGGEKSGQLIVQATSIDSLFCKTDQRITFIKIDTEGHELSCIKGALGTINKYRPSLLIEISSDLSDAASDGSQIKNILKEYGYQMWHFDEKKLLLVPANGSSVNYFFLTAEHIQTLQKHGMML